MWLAHTIAARCQFNRGRQLFSCLCFTKQQIRIKIRLDDWRLPSMSYRGKITNSEDDPVVCAFLGFLEKDMIDNSAGITALDANFIARAKALTPGMVVTDNDLE
jgi:hypothetical protein